MVKNKTHTKSLADVSLVFALPIPQGDNVEIKVEQSQCNFYLNEKIVEQIQQAQKAGLSLNIPTKLLIYLWFSTCFQYNFVPDMGAKNHRHKSTRSYRTFLMNIFRIFRSKPLQNQTNIQIECTFNSYYSSEYLIAENTQYKDCILQTIVFFYGDVMQKIQQNFLQSNDNLMEVVSAHYWLIEQLLSSLRNKLNMLLWELASLFPAGFLVTKIYQLNIFNIGSSIFLLILTWLGIALLVILSRYILFNQLQKRVGINYQYLNWLAWGISCIIPAIAIILTQQIQAIDIILFPIISAVAPLIVGQIFRLLVPPTMKLIVRRFL